MVTQIDPISTPPTPADPPEVFEEKASQVWSDLYAAVPKMNLQAQEVEALAQAAAVAKEAALAGSDAAMGYRNEARAARDVAAGHAGSAAADAAAAGADRAAADQSAGSAGSSADRAEAAADAAEGVLANAVTRTSPTGAAVLPEGPQTDRPDPVPEAGLVIRLNSTSGKPEWFNRVKAAWQPFGTDGGELFSYAWHNGPRSSIAALTPGRIPADGQQITLLQYPDAVQAVLTGKQNAVTEAVWQADPSKRNCWSLGDGATWVRVPDLNAVQVGTGKPFYLRGGPDELNGTSVGDAIRNIVGSINHANNHPSGNFGFVNKTYGAASGAMKLGASSANSIQGLAGEPGYAIEFDASRTVPTADENRVKTAYGVMTVRIFTEAANASSVDAATLATQLAVVDAKAQALDAATGFTILYPNGGTAAAPANVSVSTRYVIANPFPGSYVMCVPQVLWNGIWADPGWDGNTGTGGQAAGVRAGVANTDVIVQTANQALLVASIHGGNLHAVPPGTVVSTPLPCRVLCWKLKGSM